MNLVQQAVFLCKNESFWHWLEERQFYVWGTVDEKQARNMLCNICGVGSRAQLASDPIGIERFEQLLHDFKTRSEVTDVTYA